MPKFYKIGFFVLLFLLAAGTAFYVGTNLNKKPAGSQKISPTPVVTEEVVVEVTATPASPAHTRKQVEEQVEAVLTSKNTAALESYMANEVFVVLESTECCGSMTKVKAIEQLDYLKEAQAPWNFDQTNETIKKLKEEDPNDYGPESTYVGIAANEYVAAFKINEDNRITGITMAVTYKLVLP